MVKVASQAVIEASNEFKLTVFPGPVQRKWIGASDSNVEDSDEISESEEAAELDPFDNIFAQDPVEVLARKAAESEYSVFHVEKEILAPVNQTEVPAAGPAGGEIIARDGIDGGEVTDFSPQPSPEESTLEEPEPESATSQVATSETVTPPAGPESFELPDAEELELLQFEAIDIRGPEPTADEIFKEQMDTAKESFLEASFRLEQLNCQLADIKAEIKDMKEIVARLASEMKDLRDQEEQLQAIELESGLNLEDPGWWKHAPIEILKLEEIPHLGRKRRDAIYKKIRTVGELELVRLRFGTLRGLPGLGPKVSMMIEDRLLTWLEEFNGKRNKLMAEKELARQRIVEKKMVVTESGNDNQSASTENEVEQPKRKRGRPKKASPQSESESAVEMGPSADMSEAESEEAESAETPELPNAMEALKAANVEEVEEASGEDHEAQVKKFANTIRSGYEKNGDNALIPTIEGMVHWRDGVKTRRDGGPVEACKYTLSSAQLNWIRGWLHADVHPDGETDDGEEEA